MKLSYRSRGAITWTNLRNSEELLNRFILFIWVKSHWRWCTAVRKENFLRIQHRDQLVVRLIAIKYNERLLCYLASYINLLMSDLWLDLDLWPRDDVSPSSRMLLTRCLVVIVLVIIICFRHRLFVRSFSVVLSDLGIALTIPSEVRAVQDGIHPLMNHALTSNHSSGPVRVNPLDHLE